MIPGFRLYEHVLLVIGRWYWKSTINHVIIKEKQKANCGGKHKEI